VVHPLSAIQIDGLPSQEANLGGKQGCTTCAAVPGRCVIVPFGPSCWKRIVSSVNERSLDRPQSRITDAASPTCRIGGLPDRITEIHPASLVISGLIGPQRRHPIPA
jgi:hypothetical protein